MNKVYYRESGAGFSTVGLEFIPGKTHHLVAQSELDENGIFEYFNIKFPEEFAESIRNNPNVGHTSMSVGDVVVKPDGTVLVCANTGWDELELFNGVWA